MLINSVTLIGWNIELFYEEQGHNYVYFVGVGRESC